MEEGRYSEEDKYLKAEKEVKKIRNFYGHLFWYVLVNLFISIIKVKGDLGRGETFNEAFFDFGTFAIWFFWGISLLGHMWSVFGKRWFFSKEWEQRKIQEFIDKENE